MQISLFQIVQAVLLGIILIYLIYYVYTVLFDKNYQPKAYQQASKNRSISTDLKKLEKKYPDKVRFFNFWFQAERLKKEKVPGAFAELGVYKGDSANLLHKMDPDREFHLFDTFEGLPEASEHDAVPHRNKANLYACSLKSVKEYLRRYDNVFFHPGLFPDSAQEIPEEETFSFAHLDVDLYESTLACLAYFYPKMIPGGIILSHDASMTMP